MAKFGGLGGWGQGLAIGLGRGVQNFVESRKAKESRDEQRILALGQMLTQVQSPELKRLGASMIGAVASGEHKKFGALLDKFGQVMQDVEKKNPQAMQVLNAVLGGGGPQDMGAASAGSPIPSASPLGEMGATPGSGPTELTAALPSTSPTEKGSQPIGSAPPSPDEEPGKLPDVMGDSSQVQGESAQLGMAEPPMGLPQGTSQGMPGAAPTPESIATPMPKTTRELGSFIHDRTSNLLRLMREEKQASRDSVRQWYAEAAAAWRQANPLSTAKNPYEDQKEINDTIARFEDDVDDRWGPIRDKLVESQSAYFALMNDPRNIAMSPDEMMDKINDHVFRESAELQLKREQERRMVQALKTTTRQADERIAIMQQNADTMLKRFNLSGEAQEALEQYRRGMEQYRSILSNQGYARLKMAAANNLNRTKLTIEKSPQLAAIRSGKSELSRQVDDAINALFKQLEEENAKILQDVEVYIPSETGGGLDVTVPDDLFPPMPGEGAQ